MTRYQFGVLLFASASLVALSGATCVPLVSTQQDALRYQPPVLPAAPTLAQVIDVINNNTARIQSFSSSQATLTVGSLPSLRANIAYEQQLHFRLRAESILGQEVDLGSNNELFWFWIRQNDPPGIYYCRHAEFASSAVRRSIPIDPYWLMEALGLVRLDPAWRYQGPYKRQDNRLELRVIRDTDQGPTTRVLILDERQGVVLAQQLYDSKNQLVAQAITGRHRRDPVGGAFLPEVVELRTPAVQGAQAFSMRIDLGTAVINRPLPNAEQLWTMPVMENVPLVDLCNSPRSLAPAPAPAAAQPPRGPIGR